MSLPYDAQRPQRRDYERAADVSADFPMQTSPGGGRHIPLIAQGMSHAARMRANQGFPDLAASPSYGLPMAAQQAPARPMGLPMAAQQGPANRFGWSQNFQDSVNRTRALRSFKQGRFASLREQGSDERSAARQAFADTQLADADLQTGGAFLNRGLAMDENTRANSLTGAEVNESGSRASLNNANAYGATERARVMLPAEAGQIQAQTGLTQADTEKRRRMLPMEAQAADQQNRKNQVMLPLEAQRMQAGTYGQVAQANAAQAQPQMTQKRLAELEKENAALRSQLNQQYAGVRSENSRLRTAQSKDAAMKNLLDEDTGPAQAPAQAAPAQATPAQSNSMPRVNTPEEARRLPKGTRFMAPDGTVRTVP
jgi:hypothetical protein